MRGKIPTNDASMSRYTIGGAYLRIYLQKIDGKITRYLKGPYCGFATKTSVYPLLPSVPCMTRLVKILIIFKKGSSKKIPMDAATMSR